MSSEFKVGDRVRHGYHPGECGNPACAVAPYISTVIKVEQGPRGPSYFVRLPCGGTVALHGERVIEAA